VPKLSVEGPTCRRRALQVLSEESKKKGIRNNPPAVHITDGIDAIIRPFLPTFTTTEENSVSESETRTAAELERAEVLQKLRLVSCETPGSKTLLDVSFPVHSLRSGPCDSDCFYHDSVLNLFQLAELHMWPVMGYPQQARMAAQNYRSIHRGKMADRSFGSARGCADREKDDIEYGKDNCDLRGVI
jgi:hypothetical protein